MPADPADLLASLRAEAMRLQDVTEGVACAGTALEKYTLKVRGKAFLFLGRADLMVKLDDALPEARALAAAEPARYKVGANGWATVRLEGEGPDAALLARWIAESHRLLSPRPRDAGRAGR